MVRYADFSRPPVVETVLSVGFAPLERLDAAHIGLFWQEVSQDFPRTAERLPYEMPIEGRRSTANLPGLQFQVGSAPPKVRLWLISEDDQRLLQVQRDWFAYNWRKRQSPYVHYEEGRDNFASMFQKFSSFVEQRELGKIEPKQCEITYINHVPVEGKEHGDLSHLLSFVRPPILAEEVPAVTESQVLNMTLAMLDGDEIFGRLYLNVNPGYRNREPIWIMNLTARGAPLGSGQQGVLAFLDRAREAVVTNFLRFTSEDLQREWKRK